MRHRRGYVPALLLAALWLLPTAAFGQFFGYNNTFDVNNGFLTAVNMNTNTGQPDAAGWAWGAPTSGPGSAFSAPNVWATNLSGNYNAYADYQLTTYDIPLPIGGTYVTLSFYSWMFTESGFDGCRMRVSTNGGTSWSSFPSGNVNPTYTNNGLAIFPSESVWSGSFTSWTQTRVNLNAYAGQTIRIMWELEADYSLQYPGWYIDNAQLQSDVPFPNIPPVVTVQTVADPQLGLGPYRVAATLFDPDDTPGNVWLHWIVGSGAAESVMVADSAGSGVFVGYIPAGTYAFGTRFEYWMTASDNGVPAAHGSSNHYFFYHTGYVLPPYCNDFETSAIGFSTEDTDQVWQWGLPAGGRAAHSPTHVVGTSLATGVYPANADNILQSFPIDLRGATSANISWWQWYALEPNYDYLTVDVWDGTAWQTTGLSYTGFDTTWTQITVNLASYLGNIVYVRWHFTSDFSGQYAGVYLDDVCLNGVVPPYGTVAGNVVLLGNPNNAGATVTLMETSASTTTDALGDYSFTYLRAGDYHVRVNDYGHIGQTRQAVPTLLGTYDTAYANFVLSQLPTGRIVGHATKFGAVNNSGITVTEPISGASFTTAADGYYHLENLPIGYQLITASAAGYQTQTGEGLVISGDSVIVNFQLYAGLMTTFEPTDGGFTHVDSTNFLAAAAGWEWGIPTNGPASAHSLPDCWGTDLDANYPVYMNWKLYSPIVDLTAMTNPVLSFWHWYSFESNYDGGNVQISTNGGTSWSLLTPVPAYNTNSISSDNAAIPSQPCWTGANGGWQQVTINLAAYSTQPVTQIRWVAGSDASVVYPGWYIDDVSITGSVVSTGAIQGFVYDDATGVPMANVTVTCQSHTSTTDVLGYYNMTGLNAGWSPVTANMAGYFPETHLGMIPAGATGNLNLRLKRMNVTISTDSIDVTIPYGSDATGSFQLCNGGGGQLTWSLVTGAAGFDKTHGNILTDMNIHLGPINPVHRDRVLDDNSATAPHDGTAPFNRPTLTSNVVQTIDAGALGMSLVWGIGADPTHFWASDVNGGLPPTVDYQFDLDGTVNHFWNMPLSTAGWGADMTNDGHGGLWQLVIGAGTSALVKLDQATGAVLQRIADPEFRWDNTSQRGLAYDEFYDVFFIGGWNNDSVYVVLGDSYGANRGRVSNAWGIQNTSGLAFEKHSRTLFVMTNNLGNPMFQVNPWTGAVLNSITFPVAPDYAGAGIEFDSRDYLIAADQSNNLIYVLDVGARPNPVIFSENGGVLDSFWCQTVNVTVSGAELPPGDYTYTFTVVIPNHDPLPITITVHVKPTILSGWNMVANPMQTSPDDPRTLLGDDFVPFNLSAYRSDMYGYTEPTDLYYIPTHLTRGDGYYLWSHFAQMYDIPGTPYTSAMTIPATFTASNHHYPGFHFTGNPFDLTIDWDQVVYNTGTYNIDARYWWWRPDSGWVSYAAFSPFANPNRFIPPFRGFFMKVADSSMFGGTGQAYFSHPNDYVLIPNDTVGVHKGAAAETDMNTWRVKIACGASTLVDANNYFGVYSAALDAHDRYDGVEPPPISGTNSLLATFPHPEWGGVNTNYLEDIKAPITAGSKTWAFRVTTDLVPVAAHLDWAHSGLDGISNIPDGMTAELVDMASGTRVNMRNVSTYAFTLDATHEFQIVVTFGTPTSVYEPTVATVSNLYSSPNPTTGPTTVYYNVSGDGHATLDLTNVLGQKIITLVDANLTKGAHSVSFSGKNAAGEWLEPGVYIYRLNENGVVTTQKLTVE